MRRRRQTGCKSVLLLINSLSLLPDCRGLRIPIGENTRCPRLKVFVHVCGACCPALDYWARAPARRKSTPQARGSNERQLKWLASALECGKGSCQKSIDRHGKGHSLHALPCAWSPPHDQLLLRLSPADAESKELKKEQSKNKKSSSWYERFVPAASLIQTKALRSRGGQSSNLRCCSQLKTPRGPPPLHAATKHASPEGTLLNLSWCACHASCMRANPSIVYRWDVARASTAQRLNKLRSSLQTSALDKQWLRTLTAFAARCVT